MVQIIAAALFTSALFLGSGVIILSLASEWRRVLAILGCRQQLSRTHKPTLRTISGRVWRAARTAEHYRFVPARAAA